MHTGWSYKLVPLAAMQIPEDFEHRTTAIAESIIAVCDLILAGWPDTDIVLSAVLVGGVRGDWPGEKRNWTLPNRSDNRKLSHSNPLLLVFNLLSDCTHSQFNHKQMLIQTWVNYVIHLSYLIWHRYMRIVRAQLLLPALKSG